MMCIMMRVFRIKCRCSLPLGTAGFFLACLGVSEDRLVLFKHLEQVTSSLEQEYIIGAPKAAIRKGRQKRGDKGASKLGAAKLQSAPGAGNPRIRYAAVNNQ